MGPQWYWRAWSDHLIGTIHSRVLRHIKDLAEADSVDLLPSAVSVATGTD
jgi:hypothetical protein